MSGKPGTAPCGHAGVHVVGQYVQCLQGCDRARTDVSDGVPDAEHDGRVTEPLCAHCGSDDIQLWPGFMVTGRNLYQCHSCNKSFQA